MVQINRFSQFNWINDQLNKSSKLTRHYILTSLTPNSALILIFCFHNIFFNVAIYSYGNECEISVKSYNVLTVIIWYQTCHQHGANLRPTSEEEQTVIVCSFHNRFNILYCIIICSIRRHAIKQ